MFQLLKDISEDIHRGLYLDHIEEASFLYEQRLSLLHDPEITWKDVGEFEDRFEAHIDALVVGGELALEVCREHAEDSDFGELHAAIRVFCRQQKGELLADVWRDIDPEDVERVKAMSDALREECPDNWRHILTKVILGAHVNRIPVAVPVVGYKRIKEEASLIGALPNVPTGMMPEIIRALGRVGEKSTCCATLLPLLKNGDDSVCAEVALSLLRLGEKNVISTLLLNAQCNKSWPLIPLGLSGDRQAVHVLLERTKQGTANGECFVALGLLGDLSVVSALHNALEDEALAEFATTGLQLISGANLYEELFVPEEVDEDELFEEELEIYKKEGKVPTKPDGQPFGETIRHLSQNPQDWEKWFEENRSKFDPKYRYRYGKMYSPDSLLETLKSEQTPNRIRQYAIEELKIRYNADFPIEIDMPVAQQEKILKEIANWVEENARRFQPGVWYFAEKIMS